MTIQQINLFNPEFVPRRDLARARYLGVGLCVAVVLSAAAAGLARQVAAASESRLAVVMREAESLKAMTDAQGSQLAARKVDAELERQLARQQALIRSHRQVARWLREAGTGETRAVSEYYRALARRTVEGVWLTRFAVDSQNGHLRIEGQALQGDLVPRYLARLGEEALLKGRAFARVEVDDKPQDRRDGQVPVGLAFRLDTAVNSREPNQ